MAAEPAVADEELNVEANQGVRGVAVAAGVLVAMLAGCEERRAPADREDVILACHEYSEAVCRAFGRCLGQDEDEVAACIQREQQGCGSELQRDSCWTNQRDAYLDCLDVEDESCADVCGDNGFCSDACVYFCPSQQRQEQVERASWVVEPGASR